MDHCLMGGVCFLFDGGGWPLNNSTDMFAMLLTKFRQPRKNPALFVSYMALFDGKKH